MLSSRNSRAPREDRRMDVQGKARRLRREANNSRIGFQRLSRRQIPKIKDLQMEYNSSWRHDRNKAARSAAHDFHAKEKYRSRLKSLNHQAPEPEKTRLSEMAAAGNNRFAITCGLLQQYMRPELKHKQSAPQMGVLASSSQSLLPLLAEEATNDARTMQLFPTHAGTSQPSEKQPPEEHAKKAPLTIFYEGQVLVFEGFPADRAKELMQLAGSGSSAALKNEAPVVPEDTASIKPLPPLPSVDLPIARKASLKRFLQKRKQRIIATDPYQKETTPGKEATEGKPVNGEPAASWLAL